MLGQNVDTNSAWLSEQLASRGVMTLQHRTVGDDLNAIIAAIREATQAAELVILTGGLGPTRDDLTRDVPPGLNRRLRHLRQWRAIGAGHRRDVADSEDVAG